MPFAINIINIHTFNMRIVHIFSFNIIAYRNNIHRPDHQHASTCDPYIIIIYIFTPNFSFCDQVSIDFNKTTNRFQYQHNITLRNDLCEIQWEWLFRTSISSVISLCTPSPWIKSARDLRVLRLSALKVHLNTVEEKKREQRLTAHVNLFVKFKMFKGHSLKIAFLN